MRYQYTIVLERNEEGGYTVTVPALKGCITEGDTLTEAIANAQEAIACYLESLLQHGEPVPSDVSSIKVATARLSEVFIAKVAVEVELPVEVTASHG
jgi:predicted RNase H-like HicB family nuclease